MKLDSTLVDLNAPLCSWYNKQILHKMYPSNKQSWILCVAKDESKRSHSPRMIKMDIFISKKWKNLVNIIVKIGEGNGKKKPIFFLNPNQGAHTELWIKLC